MGVSRRLGWTVLGCVLPLFLGLSTGCASLRAAQLYQSGSAALERGDVELSIRELEGAATLAPQASEIQNHLGLAYAAADRHERAQEAFDRAVALDCENEAAELNRRSHRSAVWRATRF